MINQATLKYIFIGSMNTKQNMGDYPTKCNEKESKIIFENIAKENKITYEERNRIEDQNQNCHYYFTTSLSGIFYLVYVDNEYPDYLINQFFDDIQKEGLNLLVDENGQLIKTAREKLKNIAEKYKMSKNVSSISAAKAELDQVHIEMRKNVNNIVSNLDDINVLENKSKKLQEGADLMRKDAKDLESVTWWRNVKFTIIIIVIVIAVLLIIILPLTLKSSGSPQTSINNTTNVNSTNKSRYYF